LIQRHDRAARIVQVEKVKDSFVARDGASDQASQNFISIALRIDQPVDLVACTEISNRERYGMLFHDKPEKTDELKKTAGCIFSLTEEFRSIAAVRNKMKKLSRAAHAP